MNLEDELYKKLESSPETEITGLVGPRGPGVSRSDADTLWTMTVSLVAWREAGGAVQKTALTLRKKVDRAETPNYRAQIKAYGVIRARVRLAAPSGSGARQALLLESLGPDESDAELQAYARELREPVTFDDPQFGKFTLERRFNHYEADAQWAGIPVQLIISASEADALAKALAVARGLWANQEDWQRRIGECAVKELLDLKNDTWLQEDESELTPQQFVGKLKAQTFDIGPYGFEIWLADGGMFGGHSIVVRGDLEEGPNEASIEG